LFSLPRFFDESRELPPSLIDARLHDREQEHSGRTIISGCKKHVHSEPPLATTQATTHLVGGGGEMVRRHRLRGRTKEARSLREGDEGAGGERVGDRRLTSWLWYSLRIDQMRG
jgi:hypothetical protein